MSSSPPPPAPADLPLTTRLHAFVLVNGGLLAVSFAAGLFIAYVLRVQASRVRRPLAEHFDPLTVVVALLSLSLLAVMARAFVRVRRRGATAARSLFDWSARLVPLTLALGGGVGAVYGARAAREAVEREEYAIDQLCAEVSRDGGDHDDGGCFDLALQCRRSSRRALFPEDQTVECLRGALASDAKSRLDQ